MTIAIIVQARLGSKRFPGKVLTLLAGKPVLQHVLERCLKIGPRVILAIDENSKALEKVAHALNVPVVIGPEDDVLERYLIAANSQPIETIMRITADCPLIEPELCKQVLDIFKISQCSYAAIDWPRGGYPKGYGCEVFSKSALVQAAQLTTDQYDREHVTPWIERNLPSVYLKQDKDESHLNYCVDYPQDIPRLEAILDERKQIA